MSGPTRLVGEGMKKKLRASRGMTLTELLVALLIVGLIGVALTTGVSSAAKVYRDATRLYEAETLCGTILTALEDEFRFSQNITTAAGTTTVQSYDSPTFGYGVHVYLDKKIYVGSNEASHADTNKLLADSAYTSDLIVPADGCEITYDEITKRVTIKLTVKSEASGGSVTHEVTVTPVDG